MNDISEASTYTKEPIPESIDEIKERLKDTFSECDDFILREVEAGGKSKIMIIIAFIDGLVKQETINTDILKPLFTESRMIGLDEELNKSTAFNILKENLLSLSQLKEVDDFSETVDCILSGNTIIYIDGNKKALKIDMKGFQSRGVQEPTTESVVRGPREGFTEDLRVNTSLVRRKVKSPHLKFETIKLGKQTHTDVCICYIKGIVNEDIVATVKRRLARIDTDAILESGYIEEFIEDSPLSLFPTVGNTEKPDIAAAKILEGRVAILCDGTPFVLTVPYLFVESIQASEDYYSRSFFSTFIRLLRMLALSISALVPGLYVAMICFHQGMIPAKLLITITASREGIPFSPFVEMFLMGISFELLREAGVRMPRAIGQAVSIVGALVLGQAAVDAGLVSNLMVIIVALTAISNFIVTPMAGTIPLIRLTILVAANILGLMGIALVAVAFYIHACSIRSFGVPYMAPFSPLSSMDLKDTFIRVPIWAMITRPRALARNNDQSSYRMTVDFRKKEE